MKESEKSQELSDEERAIRLRAPYEKATREYLEILEFIENGWGDPDLLKDEEVEKFLTEPASFSDADLPTLIRERGKLWARPDSNN